jgi:hypothetical protein
MEIVPANVSENDLRDEVNCRTCKAGYTTRDGLSPYKTKIMGFAIVGRAKKKYDNNYRKIFGHD